MWASQLVAIAALSHENVAEPQCVTFQVGPPNGDVLDDQEVEVTSLHIGNPKVWHFTIPPALQVHAIRRWWRTMAKKRHPRVKRLLITADGGGGSNGYRVRLWKVELQKVPITVCHLPSDTRKWNKIEARLFSFITINSRGKPLRSYRTIVQLIAATTTDTGLKVHAELDEEAQ